MDPDEDYYIEMLDKDYREASEKYKAADEALGESLEMQAYKEAEARRYQLEEELAEAEEEHKVAEYNLFHSRVYADYKRLMDRAFDIGVRLQKAVYDAKQKKERDAAKE